MSEQDIFEVLYGKRLELERSIDSYGRKIVLLKTDLANMLAVLAFHEQNIATSDFLPHMSVRRLFSRGEILGYCLAALRSAGRSLDTRELARHVIGTKGMDPDDSVLRKKIVFSVMQAMKTGRKRRVILDDGRRLGVRLWKLRPP